MVVGPDVTLAKGTSLTTKSASDGFDDDDDDEEEEKCEWLKEDRHNYSFPSSDSFIIIPTFYKISVGLNIFYLKEISEM